MELTAEMVEATLEMLRDHGVLEFEGLGFHVKFHGPKASAQEAQAVQKSSVAAPPRSAWEDPNLWGGGGPPAFPGKDK